MATKEEALQVLGESKLIMLASNDGDQPCIRILDFVLDGDKILFVANSKSAKCAQFAANNKVAFSAMPPQGPGMTIRCNEATVALSDKPASEVTPTLLAKRPPIENMLNSFGDNAVVYEITFPALLAKERGVEARVEM